MDTRTLQVSRLRVTADADAGAVARVLQRFVDLGAIPRRVTAAWSSCEFLHIEVDVAGLDDDRMTFIALKVEQHPTVHRAYWHRL